MPFYPLPLSYRMASLYHRTEGFARVLVTPIAGVLVGVAFLVDGITLPVRWLVHEVAHIYSDKDESAWHM